MIDALPTATFSLRLLAKLTDLLIVSIVEIALLCAFMLLQALGLSSLHLMLWLVGILVVFVLTYFSVLTCGGRQTPGYRLAGLRVVRDVPPGQPTALRFGRALGRATLDLICLSAVGYGVGLIDYLPVAVTRQKRALHDLVAGTRVERVGNPHYAALALCAVGFIAVPAAAVFGVIRPLLLQTFYMPSPGMSPTLPVNSHFFVNKVHYRFHAPRRGDIVVFSVPEAAAAYFPSDYSGAYVKRIIGVPGDEIRQAEGRVYFWDGSRAQAMGEPYLAGGFAGDLPEPDGTDTWFTSRRSDLVSHGGHWWIRVPPGQYYVLGDNRNDSNDSHIWGFLPVGNILGKVTLAYSPRIQEF